eukprot:2626538-Ditylum_brightwellii.AAC.1
MDTANLVSLQFAGPWSQAGRYSHTVMPHYNYNMHHTTIKLIYKCPEARLGLQSLTPSDLLDLG